MIESSFKPIISYWNIHLRKPYPLILLQSLNSSEKTSTDYLFNKILALAHREETELLMRYSVLIADRYYLVISFLVHSLVIVVAL